MKKRLDLRHEYVQHHISQMLQARKQRMKNSLRLVPFYQLLEQTSVQFHHMHCYYHTLHHSHDDHHDSNKSLDCQALPFLYKVLSRQFQRHPHEKDVFVQTLQYSQFFTPRKQYKNLLVSTIKLFKEVNYSSSYGSITLILSCLIRHQMSLVES